MRRTTWVKSPHSDGYYAFDSSPWHLLGQENELGRRAAVALIMENTARPPYRYAVIIHRAKEAESV